MGAAHEGEVDELTAGTARLRALARALVGDAHAAEDLVQDAWVAALERGRTAGQVSGGWLAGVLKRLALHRARSERHRADRELDHARGSREEPDPDERLASVEQLVAAVRALDEPYKTAILLRYFEDRRPVEIAARLGVPVRTVHTRLSRALAELRERLDRRHGDRRAWLALFAPLAKAPNAQLAGGWIVQTKSKIALAVVVVLCLGAAWLAAIRGDAASGAQALAPAEVVQSPASSPATPDASPSGAGERTALATPDAAKPTTAARVRGVVIGLDDLPLAEQRVVFVDESSHAPLAGFECLSDAQGRFDLPHPGRRGVLDLADSPFVTVLQPLVVDPPEDAELVLVAARRAPLAGVVVAADDQPIEGAELRIDAPGLRGSVLRILDRSRSVALRARSGAQGRFVIPDAPAIPEANLVTSCPKFLTYARTLSGDADSALIIRMELEPRTGRWLRGKVVDSEGRAVPGACIGWVPFTRSSRSLVESTDAKGRFDLALPEFPPGIPPSIQAVAAGFLPATVASSRPGADDPPQWPDPLILRLAEPASSLGGRVLDSNGAPVVGAELRIIHQHDFGKQVSYGEEGIQVGTTTIEGIIAGAPFAWDRCDRSAADGSFEIRGLLEEPYQLRCFDPSSLAVVRTQPIAAGARDVVIHLPPIERIPVIAGTVIDSNGQPVAGADVTLHGRDEVHDDRGKLQSSQDLSGASVKTDREGRFEFRDAPHGMTSLSARTPGSLAIKTFQLADQPDPEHLRLEVSRACHVQVDLRGSAVTARTAAILDAHGEFVEVTARTGDAATTFRQFMLVEGRSAAVIAPDDAAMLVLSDIPEGQQSFVEVARIPIHLKSGELNVLRP